MTTRPLFSFAICGAAVMSCVLALAACAQEAESAASTSATSTSAASSDNSANADAAERGFETYMRVGCHQCHGTVGQGGGAVGPRLAPDPHPTEVITAYIRNPGGRMPAYPQSVLSDSEVADIHAYLASLPPPPPLESIDLLQGE